MKNFLLVLVLLAGFGFEAQAKKFRVDFTVTSSEGCTFRIVGEVDVSLSIPVSNSTINGFNGSITIGGASGCPNGTFNVNFGLVTAGDSENLPSEDEEIIHALIWNDTRMQDRIEEIFNP